MKSDIFVTSLEERVTLLRNRDLNRSVFCDWVGFVKNSVVLFSINYFHCLF